jgi:hypothetical protein
MTRDAHVEPPPSAAGVPLANSSQQSSAKVVLRPIAYVAMAAGAASLLGAGVVALVANTNRTADCPDYLCRSDEAMQSYDSLRTASTVAFYVGAALLVGGFVTWVVVPSAQQTRESRVRWDVGPGGVRISGAF